jgi:two-component system OmpR family response regulator
VYGWRHRRLRVLIVDDDPSVQRVIAGYLEQHDMRVVPVRRRRDVPRQFSIAEPDMVLLDLRLGEEDGLDVLRDIRLRSDVPVIITSCDRGDETDRVVGLELGADDYLSKPFGLRELLARIRVVLRRQDTGRVAADQAAEQGCCRFDIWLFDRRTRRLTGRDGNAVTLTKGEYRLLSAFLDAPQRPLSRDHLLRAMRAHEDRFDRSIDAQILRLRRKLERDPSAPRIILTERGVGYIFTPQVERL